MDDLALRRDCTLLDLVDRILDTGVTLSGDVVLSVADVDLVYVSLRSLLASVDAAFRTAPGAGSPSTPSVRAPMDQPVTNGPQGLPPAGDDAPPAPTERARTSGGSDDVGARGRTDVRPNRARGLDTRPENIERGLAKLVLTLIEFLRQLMERQAMRRMDADALTDEEIERLGRTFMRLADRMEDLKRAFGLEGEELNLNLGPLGDLV